MTTDDQDMWKNAVFAVVLLLGGLWVFMFAVLQLAMFFRKEVLPLEEQIEVCLDICGTNKIGAFYPETDATRMGCICSPLNPRDLHRACHEVLGHGVDGHPRSP
jgi:hypothetical protein